MNALQRVGRVRRRAVRSGAVLVALLLADGCADFGKDIPAGPAPSPGDAPVINELVPFRTFPGDTVQVIGSRFGTTPGRVVFTSAALRAVVDATVVTWDDDTIVVLSPSSAADGPVRVQVGELVSEAADFVTAPQRSFAADVAPLFDYLALGPGRYNCASCHAFCDAFCSGGLAVLPYDLLMQGSSIDGPVVIPRRSESSRLIQRLLPTTPIPLRMPQDGLPSYMGPDEILVIADWIDQGARNN